MKTLLRLTIRISWACLGLFCCWMVGELLWSILSGRLFAEGLFQQGMIWLISGSCALVLGLFLLGILIYAAWLAVFRFSETILAPTAFIVGLIMLATAQNGDRRFVELFLNPQLGIHPAMPFLGLVILITVLAGWITFYRVMPLILARVLFPRLSASVRSIL